MKVFLAIASALLTACATTGTPVQQDIARLERASRAAPEDPVIRYSICADHDQAGELDEVVRCLEALEKIPWPMALEPSDFPKSAGREGFEKLAARFQAREPKVERSTLAFTAPGALVPENVAFDPKSGAFFLGSLPQHRIVRVRDGHLDNFTKGTPLLEVTGMKVDAARRTLWAASAAMHGADPGRAELVAFDVDSGALLGRFPSPADGKQHLFNDVVVTSGPAEEVFVTDSLSGAIYRVAARGALHPLLPEGTFVYPNGIAMSPDEKKLFVAYDLGIAVVDIARGTFTELAHPALVPTGGVDGLYFNQGALVAVQNGAGRARVVRFWLDEGWSRVVRGEILESGNPDFEIPTTGVLNGNMFYYIANSQLHSLRPGAKHGALKDIRILSISLDAS